MRLSQHAARFTAAAALLFASVAYADVDPIVIKGTKFFYKTNGTQFFMRGIAYQQEAGGNGTVTQLNYRDPLADVDACRRDVPYMQDLRTNIIRVYAIDPTKDHSVCMKLLQDAGIYVIADLSEPKLSINRDDPVWNRALYNRYTSVVDELAKYTNTFGFFAGNEVSNALNNTQASAFVKAAVRDTKAYIKQRNYRPMGVGYATNDDQDILVKMQEYFACDPRESSVDFWGYNVYSWCGKSTFQKSGYADRTKMYANYPVPVFFAEYGCNQPKPRLFEDVQALYGSDMTSVWSGGIVYMYFQEANDYGLVSVEGDTVSKLPDYTYLSRQIAKATPTGVSAGSYNPTNTRSPACPTVDRSWNASAVLPPTPNADVCGCVVRNLTCVAKPGLSDTKMAELFSTVCGLDRRACAGIAVDAASGRYGAMSPCNSTEKLSWAFNAYYNNASPANRASACDFDGNAQLQTPAPASDQCRPLLSQVGSAATGSITSAPSATGGGGASSSGTRASAAGAITVPSVDFGLLQLSAYILGAVLTGAGMILL